MVIDYTVISYLAIPIINQASTLAIIILHVVLHNCNN